MEYYNILAQNVGTYIIIYTEPRFVGLLSISSVKYQAKLRYVNKMVLYDLQPVKPLERSHCWLYPGEWKCIDKICFFNNNSIKSLILLFYFQFLCLRNIKIFLQVGQDVFGLKESDLFEPSMLFDLTDFYRVLYTLSRLSNCPKVLKNNHL